MTIQSLPEWGKQDWLWIGFPHDAREWPRHLGYAQEQIAAFANAVAESGQEVRLVVRDKANAARARELVSASVTLQRARYGDIWLRDTGPMVAFANGERRAMNFRFNGWGGKYQMPGDDTVSADLAEEAGLAIRSTDWVLEGGAIDHDGTGLCVTTEQCLLNPNRNPHLTRADIEAKLHSDLGVEQFVWLGEGLQGDHTDGHVDNLARFVGANHLVIPRVEGSDDPNASIYEDAAQTALEAGCTVTRIPSVGRYQQAGSIAPASYANFVITNSLVVVPQFGAVNDAAAVEAIGELFPGRKAVGLPSDAVLTGGGSFHCASMHMPAEPDAPTQEG